MKSLKTPEDARRLKEALKNVNLKNKRVNGSIAPEQIKQGEVGVVLVQHLFKYEKGVVTHKPATSHLAITTTDEQRQ